MSSGGRLPSGCYRGFYFPSQCALLPARSCFASIQTESELLDSYMSGHDSPHKAGELSGHRCDSDAAIPTAEAQPMISTMQSSACFLGIFYKSVIKALPLFAKRSTVLLSTHELPAALDQKPPQIVVACLGNGSTSDGVAA